MRALILLVALASGGGVFGQTTILLKAELTGVSLFRDQAELSFEASTAVAKGTTSLVVRGVPVNVSPSSIRLRVSGEGVLLGFELSAESPDTAIQSRQIALLRDSLLRLRRIEARAEGSFRVNGQERDIYLKNTNLEPARVTPEAVRLIASTTRKRLDELEVERLSIEGDLNLVRSKQSHLLRRIDSLRTLARRPTQQLTISFSAPVAGPLRLSYSYLTASARWQPEYVLNVPATGPSRLKMLARITNNTGIDWVNQRISFSSANPSGSSTPPAERKRTLPEIGRKRQLINGISTYLEITNNNPAEEGFVTGKVIYESGEPLVGAIVAFVNSLGATVGGTYTDMLGQFKIKYPVDNAFSIWLRVSYVGFTTLDIPKVKPGGNYVATMAEEEMLLEQVVTGYGGIRGRRSYRRESDSDAQSTNEFISIDDLQLFQTYQLDQPISLAGDGSTQTLSLVEYPLPLSRRHRASPADDPDAFLVGEIRGWQALNLVSGPMRISYEGSFVGQSRINAREQRDTVEVGLGRDSRVLVKRERDRQFTQRQFLGDRVRDRRSYSIAVRNARIDSVTLVLRDYVPVSLRDDITVELLEAGGADHQRESGVLLWNLNLAPGESRILRFSYELRYPRSRYTIPLD
jgi:hypothetical protein